MYLCYFLDHIGTESRGETQLHQLNVVACSSLARLEHKGLICQQRHIDPFTHGEWMLSWEHTHDWFPANYLDIHHWSTNRQAEEPNLNVFLFQPSYLFLSPPF